MTGKLLTAEQLAEYLNISRHAVYCMVFRREIPHLKLGRRVRFDPIEVQQWLEDQKISPNGYK